MIDLNDALDKYKAAKKQAKRYAAEYAGDAFGGLLPVLENIAPPVSELTAAAIGIIDAPMSKIRGTVAAGRASAFAGNYLPLLPSESEFAQKWIMLYHSHINEGIRDEGTAYEYLGYYYIVEGNKRASVLRSLDDPSMNLDVTRLIPTDQAQDLDTRLYLEWLNAAPRRKAMTMWLTSPGGHTELYALMSGASRPEYPEDWMDSAYSGFRAQYHKMGFGKLPMTTGDSFLTYVKLYGFPYETDDNLIIDNLKLLERQLLYQAHGANTQSRPVKPKTRQAFFVYEQSPASGAWDAAHDYGRRVLSEVLPEVRIETFEGLSSVPNVDNTLRELCEKAEDSVVFLTGTGRRAEARRAQLASAQAQTLVCHCYPKSDNHLSPTYYGRTDEPAFVLGALAGSLTDAPAVVYAPGSLEQADVSAFALGASVVNRRAKTVCKADGETPRGHGIALIAGEGGLGWFPGVIARLVRLNPGDGRVTGWLASASWNFGAFYCALCVSLWGEEGGGILQGANLGAAPVHFESGLDSGLLGVHLNHAELPRTALLLAETVIGRVKRSGVPTIEENEVEIIHI